MKKYFAYIRVSTVKQGERGSSLAEQKSAIEAYAARNKLTIEGWYEEMETAAKQGRRQFAQMMAALAANKAQGVIIHKIDRSARNLRDWANLGDLIDRGVDVRFVTDNFDLLSRGGRLSADIQAVVAADFIRNLRDEVRKGMYGRLRQGLYPWKAPPGYLDTGRGNSKIVDPVRGPLVRLMFERYATNTLGLHALRREMYEEGLRTETGKTLSVNGVDRILNNPFYMGVIRIGSGETFPGVHVPLVSKALFDRVQSILHGRTVPKSRKNHFLLRQIVKCDQCGRRTLTGELQKGILYYRCHSHACRGISWRSDTLENIVLGHIRRIRLASGGRGDVGMRNNTTEALHPYEIWDLRTMVEAECRERQEDVERLKVSLDLRLQNIDDRITRLTDLLIDGAIDRTTYNARKEQLLMGRQGLLGELNSTTGRSPLADLFEKFELNNSKLLRYESMTGDEKRELIEIVCSNFSVYSNSPVFTLRSPYREIAELDDLMECEPTRDDVRTQRVFEILKTMAGEGPISNISSPRPLVPRVVRKRGNTARSARPPISVLSSPRPPTAG